MGGQPARSVWSSRPRPAGGGSPRGGPRADADTDARVLVTLRLWRVAATAGLAYAGYQVPCPACATSERPENVLTID